MAAIGDFLKENVPKVAKAAGTNIIFLPGYAKDLAESESKLKAIVKVTADWLFWTLKLLAPLRTFFVGGAIVLGFNKIGQAIKTLVRDTGSLAEAMRRLQSIQISERQLAPFVGGVAAAKSRIAELLTLSARGPFKFEEIAQANHSLEVFTRGAYSSAEATKTIGQAAIASGSQIGEVADAVGSFYQNLREGRPIESSAEQLRQLGIISQGTANELMAMNKAGDSSTEVFNKLTTAITSSTAGTQAVKDDLATVTAEHEKAAAELQKRFGAPWVAADIQNTKNMTAAMQAIGPTVGRISEFLAQMFNGFSTVKSGLISFVSRIPLVQGALESLVKVFGAVMAAAALMSGVMVAFAIPSLLAFGNTITNLVLPVLTKLPISATLAARAATLLGTSFKVLAVGGAIGIAATAALILVSAVASQVHIFRQASREAEAMARGFDKSNKAILDQIGNIRTLTDLHDALVASMNQVVDAHQAVIGARQKDREDLEKMLPVVRDFTILMRGIGQLRKVGPRALIEEPTGGGPRERVAQQAEARAEQARTKAARTTALGLGGPERQRVIEQRAAEFTAEQQQRLQRELISAGPTRRPQIGREQAELLRIQSEQGKRGLAARADVAQKTAEIEKKRVDIQTRVAKAEQDLAVARAQPIQAIEKGNKDRLKKTIEDGGKELIGVDAKILQQRLSAQEGTAVKQAARAEQIRRALAAGAAREAGKPAEAEREKARAGGEEIRSGPAKEAAIRELKTLEVSQKILENREEESTALAEGARMRQAEVDEEERLLRIEQSRTDAEDKIVGLKLKAAKAGLAEGDTAREEYEIRKQQLQTELEIERQRPAKLLTGDEIAKVDALQKKIEELKKPEPIKPTVSDDEAKAKIADLQAQIDKIQSPAPIQPQVSIDEAKAKIADLQGQIEKLKAPTPIPLSTEQFEEAKRKITELKAQQAALPAITAATPPAEEAAIRGKGAAIGKQITKLETPQMEPAVMTDEAKAKIADLQKQIEALKKEPIEPKVVTDDAQAKVAALQRQIASLRPSAPIEPKVLTDDAKAQVAALQKQIDAIKGPAAGGDPLIKKQLEDQGKVLDLREVDRQRTLAVTRQEGDINLQERIARRTGRSEEMIALRNQEEFVQRMEQHRGEGLGEEESKRRAMAETEESIAERAKPIGGLPAVASSLGRLGLGGGVYAPGGDPALTIQKQVRDLNKDANTYLKNIQESLKVALGVE